MLKKQKIAFVTYIS